MQIVQQAFDALEPGAYFESQELDSSLGCDDGTVRVEGALARWLNTKCDRSMITGAIIMKEAYEEVGFVDVQEIMFKVPTNGWAKDGHLKEIGKMWEKNLLSGLTGFSLGLFHRTLNMSPEEVENSAIDAVITWSSFEATMIPSRLVRPSRHLTRSAGSTAILLTLRSVDRPRPFAQSRLHSSRDPHERLKNARPLVPDVILRKIDSVGRSRNSRAVVAIAVIGAIAFYFYNSQTVPVTGRRRFNFLSDKMVQQAHSRAAEAVILAVEEQGGHFLSDWDPRTILVKRVMKRLIPVSGLPELDWEVRVIADDRGDAFWMCTGTANAFVLPGGKVFVHSGILDVCRNEDALAAVLGHEIAHNTASHVAERLSAAWVGNLTTGSLFFLAGALPGLTLFALWTFAGGFYLQDFLYYLPMGRKQESEADYIGLMMMAEACYDPRQAVGFWQRMEMIQKHGGSFLPESLSTHPSNEYRINKIKEWLPVAMEKRRESDCSGTSAFADRFRIALRRGIPVHEV
ncbi:Peptidase M48 [Metarhizium rileyi]|uniref:Peptidase M48 n=1 Tax=Metarhizium rileyi (strain RCEF 4871) TaxID=1649241 RepID=A0A162JBM2_METRR|nr:Peptidase M48 [Metarhizium rileyi RCEF 4871]